MWIKLGDCLITPTDCAWRRLSTSAFSLCIIGVKISSAYVQSPLGNLTLRWNLCTNLSRSSCSVIKSCRGCPWTSSWCWQLQSVARYCTDLSCNCQAVTRYVARHSKRLTGRFHRLSIPLLHIANSASAAKTSHSAILFCTFPSRGHFQTHSQLSLLHFSHSK